MGATFLFGGGERGPPFPLHRQAELDGLLARAFDRTMDLEVAGSIPVFAQRKRWQAWRLRR